MGARGMGDVQRRRSDHREDRPSRSQKGCQTVAAAATETTSSISIGVVHDGDGKTRSQVTPATMTTDGEAIIGGRRVGDLEDGRLKAKAERRHVGRKINRFQSTIRCNCYAAVAFELFEMLEDMIIDNELLITAKA